MFQGTKSYLLETDEGQTLDTYSISAGLDYASVGPEHAWLKDIGRVNYSWATDEEAMNAFRDLSQTEGIIPAIESSHAVAGAYKAAADLKAKGYDKAVMIVNISGRGDKDMATAGKWFGYLTDVPGRRARCDRRPRQYCRLNKKRRFLIMTNEATTPSGQPLGISHKPSKSGAMFTKFKAENKPAFIGYLPYGFPRPGRLA